MNSLMFWLRCLHRGKKSERQQDVQVIKLEAIAIRLDTG